MPGTCEGRDTGRAAVYRAERLVHGLFDHASAAAGTVDCLGVNLTLPPEARFGSIPAVQDYVDRVLALLGRTDGVRVRSRAGDTAAHYERGPAVIAMPAGREGGWALRELVVLHELAHHLTGVPGPAHGPEFTGTLIDLASEVMGPEAGLALTVVFRESGVPIGHGADLRSDGAIA